MYKIIDRSEHIEVEAMVGIFPVEESDGLQAAQAEGISVGSDGIESVKAMADDLDLVFEATSAKVHADHAPIYEDLGLFAIDLTPAAIGPFAVPVANMDELTAASSNTANVNMITCGGQSTIPVVHAVNSVCDVKYAEIVSTIASKSAGPGTRKNIDEFTQTTATGLEAVGGADEGKAIIVLNPAEPPILNRNTVYTEVAADTDIDEIRDSVADIEADVQEYVPGYRVTLDPIVKEDISLSEDTKVVTTMTEVEGEGQFLPNYAGNLDIMTSAALGAAERLAETGLPDLESTEVA
jgi:acetaldehyde dehydrogenase